MGVKWESPGFGRGFLYVLSSIVADWWELLCKLYLFVFMELGGLGLDTGFCWGFRDVSNGEGKNKQRQRQNAGILRCAQNDGVKQTAAKAKAKAKQKQIPMG